MKSLSDGPGRATRSTNASLNWMFLRLQHPRDPRPTPRRWAPQIARAGLLPSILLAGCANPGPPKPPSLHLPRPASQTTAVRTGDRVELTWTTSAQTSDGAVLRGAIHAAICRDPARKTPSSKQEEKIPCTTVLRLSVVPGTSRATDNLPPELLTGPPALLIYRVQLFNDRDRSAGPSDPFYVAAGPAPAAAGDIQVSTRRNGPLITWKPKMGDGPDTAPMELHRILVTTSSGPVPHAQPKKRSPSSGSASTAMTVSDLTLRADALTQVDPGGMVDRTLHDGDTVTYIAQRVRRVQLEVPAEPVLDKKGKAKETTPTTANLEVRGIASAPVTFTFHDTVPPAAPTGLAAVPGGGFGQPPSIDLSWDPNPEQDLLGYNIYRSEASGTSSFAVLNVTPVTASEFRDLTVTPGHPYLYRVTAVDVHRNESSPSATLQERSSR